MNVKKLLAALCAAILIFAATGCASKMPEGNQADTDAVRGAVDKFRACESFTVAQRIDWMESVTLDGDTGTYKATNETEVSFISGEQAQMLSSTLTRVENGSDVAEQSTVSYIIPEDGGYTEYYSDETQWLKVRSEDSEALAGISAANFVDPLFTDYVSFSKAGIEEGLTRYDGALSGEYLLAMLEVNGQLSDLSSMSESQQAKILENLMNDLDYVTVSVWLDEASGYPVRFTVSLTEILDDMNKSISKTLGNKAENSEWAITEYVITVTARDFNAVGEIVLPAEAADAIPYEAQ